MRTIRIPLPGGTLKLKRSRRLRRREAAGSVPVYRIGDLCVVWWPLGAA